MDRPRGGKLQLLIHFICQGPSIYDVHKNWFFWPPCTPGPHVSMGLTPTCGPTKIVSKEANLRVFCATTTFFTKKWSRKILSEIKQANFGQPSLSMQQSMQAIIWNLHPIFSQCGCPQGPDPPSTSVHPGLTPHPCGIVNGWLPAVWLWFKVQVYLLLHYLVF